MFKFDDFLASGSESGGVYNFSLNPSELRNAIDIVKNTSTGFGSISNSVRVTLFESKVRFSTFNYFSFSDVFVGTLGAVLSYSGLGFPVTFVFDLNLLDRVAKTLGSDLVKMNFSTDTKTLIVSSGRTHLNLSTSTMRDFDNYTEVLEKPREASDFFDAKVLVDSLKYVSMFTDKNMVGKPNYHVTTVRDGEFLAGSIQGVAQVENNFLGIPDMSFKNEQLKCLMNILSKMESGRAKLFELGNYWIFRDHNIYLGLEKTVHDFPKMTKFISDELTNQSIRLDRYKVISALNKLSSVSSDVDRLVKLTFKDGILRLETEDLSGKISYDECLYYIKGDHFVNEITISVKLSLLKKIVEYFRNDDFVCQVSKKCLFIFDSNNKEPYGDSYIQGDVKYYTILHPTIKTETVKNEVGLSLSDRAASMVKEI